MPKDAPIDEGRTHNCSAVAAVLADQALDVPDAVVAHGDEAHGDEASFCTRVEETRRRTGGGTRVEAHTWGRTS